VQERGIPEVWGVDMDQCADTGGLVAVGPGDEEPGRLVGGLDGEDGVEVGADGLEPAGVVGFAAVEAGAGFAFGDAVEIGLAVEPLGNLVAVDAGEVCPVENRVGLGGALVGDFDDERGEVHGTVSWLVVRGAFRLAAFASNVP
jgi:hypothetical protein